MDDPARNTPNDSARGGERQRADKGYLPRLGPEFYRGRAFVHWTLTVDDRATGWLTPACHQAWQFMLLHACTRWKLVCPVYVLMPDHVHLLWLGLDDATSDQRLASEFLRKELGAAIAPHHWQKQAHDHVLRDTEREAGAFQIIADYIRENPVRAGICSAASDYAYTGCCVPGYPEFNVHAEDYWLRFWRVYNYLGAKI